MENQPMRDLLWHTRFRWYLWPHHVTGDTTYGTIENITAVEREGIRAYVSLPNYEERTGRFPKSRFIYDAERDVYRCPQGEELRRYVYSRSDEKIKYRADKRVCAACPVREHCTNSKEGRKIERSFDEEYVERVRGYAETEGYQKAVRKRRVWIEPLFGEAKDWHGLRRFRLRRLAKVNIEALVVASGQNVKRLVNAGRWRDRPRPGGVMHAALPPLFQRYADAGWRRSEGDTRVAKAFLNSLHICATSTISGAPAAGPQWVSTGCAAHAVYCVDVRGVHNDEAEYTHSADPH